MDWSKNCNAVQLKKHLKYQMEERDSNLVLLDYQVYLITSIKSGNDVMLDQVRRILKTKLNFIFKKIEKKSKTN